jgi:hypothetical protein
LIEICNKWDQFATEYELHAAEIVQKVKERQSIEAAEFEAKIREELAPKMHYSKYLLELQTKEK